MRNTSKILAIIGTRPEAIKMAPVISELKKLPNHFSSIVCVTGQHRQMLDQALELFNITPDYDFDLMRTDQTLAKLTANLFLYLDDVLNKENPNWVLAQGDTTTVLVSSLCAFYHKIPFGHVEAGLRTGDLHKPFPEEANRRIADSLATLFFAPTERARENLISEGLIQENIHVTGNTVIDALLDIVSRPYDWKVGPLADIPHDKRIIFITAHRRESFGKPFEELCAAIRELAIEFHDKGVIFAYPVHLNPNVQAPVRAILSGIDNIYLLPPLDYLASVQLMKNSTLILTDSGGIQEEAPSLRVPVLVMRDVTERPEGVEAGVVRLVGTHKDRIIRETRRLLKDARAYNAMRTGINPYGDGRAAERIVSCLMQYAD